MRFFIRDINTFAVLSMYECGDYSLSFDLRSNSSITVPSELYNVEGNIICCYETGVQQGWCGVINALRVADGSTILQVSPITALFDTDYAIPRGSVSAYSTGCNGLIWDVITTNHTNSTDPVYKMPWLVAYYNQDTKKAEPDKNDADLFNLKEYIDDRIAAGDTKCEVWLNNSYISMAFGSNKNDVEIYDMTTGRHQLNRETYSSNVVARVTAHTSNDADPPVWSSSDYYLLDDGTYTQTASDARRVRGKWVHLYNPDDSEIDDAFSGNQYKAEIDFYTKELPETYLDYHYVRIKLENGKIINTVITGIKLTSSDKRFQISTGLVVSNRAKYIEAAYTTAAKTAAQLAALRRS